MLKRVILELRKGNDFMERYKNLGGNSGVAAYEIDSNSITVQFVTGSVYLYTYKSTGSENIEEMKLLAISGQGLNSFISKYVKKSYESKLR
jgi:hypothetical protein